jgi:hypothetical protein
MNGQRLAAVAGVVYVVLDIVVGVMAGAPPAAELVNAGGHYPRRHHTRTVSPRSVSRPRPRGAPRP